MAESIRVVIADDHAVLRESLTALLNSQPDIEVMGSASNGTQALEIVQKVHPDVLVLDLAMPSGDGFDVLRTLDRAGTRVASVILTGSESQQDYVQVVCLGARGLVLKGAAPTNLSGLSERERQISFLVARGYKNKDIAAELVISENTVKRHLQSIFSK